MHWQNITLGMLADAVVVCDAQGQVVHLNTAAERLFGVPCEQAIGAPLNSVATVLDRSTDDCITANLSTALLAGPVTLSYPLSLLLVPSGRRRMVEFAAAPLRSQQGAVTGSAIVLRDSEQHGDTNPPLSETLRYARYILRANGKLAIALDSELRIVGMSPLFFSSPLHGLGQTEGKLLTEDEQGRWDILALRKLIQRAQIGKQHAVIDESSTLLTGSPQRVALEVFEVLSSQGSVGLVLLEFSAANRPVTSLPAANPETRYHALLDSIDEGFCVIEVLYDEAGHPCDWIYLETNPAFELQTGLQNVVGRRISKIAPNIESHWSQVFGEIVRTGESARVTNQASLATDQWFEVFAFRLGDAIHRQVAVLFTNVTEKREAAERLEESELRYRQLFRTAQDGILILDVESMAIIDSNPQLHRLLGATRSQIHGKQLWQIGIFSKKSDCEETIKRVLVKGFLQFEDLPIVHTSGVQLSVELNCSVYREGRRGLVQCNLRDITQRKQLELRTQEQAAQLAEASQRKDEFLAILSHELRSPLAPIYTAVQLFHEDESLTPRQQEACDMIERQTHYLVRLVDDLLDVSRISSGKINLRCDNIQLQHVVERVVERLRSKFALRRQQLRIQMPQEPIWLYADPLRLEQVVGNLLHNASKFTDPAGQVMLSLTRSAEQVEIKITDTGCGIPPELLPKVFDLYQQAEATTQHFHSGLGIGLTLVKHLVWMHGGTIEVFSEGSGQGSEFVLQLPIRKSPSLPSSSQLEPQAQVQVAPLRILLVDDHVDIARSSKLLLESWGHEAQVAHSGHAAIAAANEFLPHLVLCDIGLPDIDGYQVARMLSQDDRTREMLLVAFTGYGREKDVIQALEAGFHYHLVKPMLPAALQKVLAKASAKAKPSRQA